MSLCDYYNDYKKYTPNSLTNNISLPGSLVDGFCQLEEKYEAPMPWIGAYVAAASVVCSFAMAADIFHGIRHRKLWFPCEFFTLNAGYLTLLAVAMKLPVDLSGVMPTAIDQLAKLTSTALLSTVIGNFMPSLGAMDDREIFMNITALAILIITIFVNICIQLFTGVINRIFIIEYIAALSFMLVLLVVSSFSALTVSTTKRLIQLNYDDIHKKISREESKEPEKFTTEKMKVNVKKFWMMAKSGSPQFVIARSVTCYASGAICFLAAFTLVEAHFRVFVIYGSYSYFPNNVGSNYKGSTFVILVIQSFAVVVGTIAPAFRWFTIIRLKSYKTMFKTERYWIERLVEWKESPLALRVRSQKCRIFFSNIRNLILDFCILVQIVIVWSSKLIVLISVILISPFLSLGHLYKVLKQKFISQHTASSNHKGSDLELDLSGYVLYLKGEEELPLLIMKNNRDATDRFIKKGEKQRPKYLKELLDKSTNFLGVSKFDNDQVPSLNSEEPSNCWSLPVVTLTSIAVALPNINDHKVKWLLQSVSEGLLYVNLVDEFLNAKSDMVNIRKAAGTVWLGVDIFRKWLNQDLRKIAVEGRSSVGILKKLSAIANKSVKENMNGDVKENPQNWSVKVIAANSMYRICQTVLQDHGGGTEQTDERTETILMQDHEGSNETLFEQLCIMIADILGACLTNLPCVINMKCVCSDIEKREKSVLYAAQLLGETEEILKTLQQRKLPGLNPDKLAYIDEWRAVIKKENPLACTPLTSDGTSSSGSGEVSIDIG